MWRWLSANAIQLVAGLSLLPVLQRAQKGRLLKSAFPGFPSPSTVVPEAMEIKIRDSETLDQPWTPYGTVQILATGSQGVSSASSVEGEKQIPGQSDNFQDSFSPAALHLKARFLTHLLQDTENNVPSSVFFPRGDTKALGPWWSEDMHRPSAGEWCVGRIESYQGKINKFCLESSQQNARGFKKQSLIAEQYVWTWFCLAKLSLGSRKAK